MIHDFKEGDRIELSEEGKNITCGAHRNRTATIISASPRREIIKILKDGNKLPSYYHHSFWKKVEGGR